jgi:hypothetical protein
MPSAARVGSATNVLLANSNALVNKRINHSCRMKNTIVLNGKKGILQMRKYQSVNLATANIHFQLDAL